MPQDGWIDRERGEMGQREREREAGGRETVEWET